MTLFVLVYHDIAHQISMYLVKVMVGNDLILKFWFYYKGLHYIIIIKGIPVICLKNVIFYTHIIQHGYIYIIIYMMIWQQSNPAWSSILGHIINVNNTYIAWDDREIIWSCVSMQGNIIWREMTSQKIRQYLTFNMKNAYASFSIKLDMEKAITKIPQNLQYIPATFKKFQKYQSYM